MASAAYDALAPHYRRYALRRAAYCDGVDRLIASWLPSQASTMLDVGSGDGVRAVQLASSLGIDALVLSDPSQPMSEQCRSHHRGTVLTCAAEALPSNAGAFDVITCVWNVLGAIEEPERRLAALHGMKERLAPAGRLFVDVHNRYNVAAAGLRRVVARMARDLVTPSQANGLVSFTWEIDGLRIPTRGYLFTDPEMRRLFAAARLTPVRHAFVHYDTGQVCGRWRGQMVWALEHASRA
ncbi:MAG: class I SAM-dependent methyltransferase [Vicinamibacterales bacterium]